MLFFNLCLPFNQTVNERYIHSFTKLRCPIQSHLYATFLPINDWTPFFVVSGEVGGQQNTPFSFSCGKPLFDQVIRTIVLLHIK